MWYRGTLFRSTLEADWAATFDEYDWFWEYEPVAVKTSAGPYLCDFYLPNQRAWCEAKGPHNERIEKPAALQSSLAVAVATDPWDWRRLPLVVILRPSGPGQTAQWEGAESNQAIAVAKCPECQSLGFMDYNSHWACRRGCNNGGENKFWKLPGGDIYWPGELPFYRAPRPTGGKAQPEAKR